MSDREKVLRKTVRYFHTWRDWFNANICQLIGHSRNSSYRFMLCSGVECWRCSRCDSQFNVDVPLLVCEHGTTIHESYTECEQCWPSPEKADLFSNQKGQP